jgi:hypothetical protein
MRDQQLNALGPLVLEHAPNVDRLETYYLQVIVMDYPRFAEESSSHHQNHSTKNVRDFRGLQRTQPTCPVSTKGQASCFPTYTQINIRNMNGFVRISEYVSRDCASAKLLATATTVGFGILLQPHLSPIQWLALVVRK